MKTAAHKRSSQELQAIRVRQSVTGLDYLKPLVPSEDEVTETHPRFIAWYLGGRSVNE